MNNERILVIGGTGALGSTLTDRYYNDNEIMVLSRSEHKQIENLCKDLCIYLDLKGPVCIQLKEDSKGNPKFIEVNPRLGGGTYFTTLAGVNFLELILNIKNNKPFIKPTFKEITVLRYFNEIVI